MIAWALGFVLTLGPIGAEATIVFGGDVALGRVVAGAVRPIGGDDPWRHVADVLRAADLAVVNLECALWDGPAPRDGIRLVAPTRAVRALASASVDLVSRANNHALDAGPAGLAATERALAAAGLETIGAGVRVRVRDLGGLRIGFVAATDRINATGWPDRRHIAWLSSRAMYDDGALVTALVRARAEHAADVWVVLLHWGEELAARPSSGQRRLARALVDAGATLVVGHGAHVVQEVERRGAGAILYSLGNLVFDMDAPATRRGALARVRFGAGEVREVTLVPTAAGPDDAPRPLTP